MGHNIEQGAGGMSFVEFQRFCGICPKTFETDCSPIQVDENNGEVDKGILYKHTGNWGWGGGLPPLFMHLVYSIISNFTPHRLLT